MSASLTLFEHRRTIDAPASVVFDLLTTPEGLRQWIARAAEVSVAPQGRITWTHDNGDTMVGRILELQPPHRLVFSYGWADGAMSMPPESTRVEITLTERDGTTELHLVHRALPVEAEPRHAEGWRWFLARLDEAACSDDQSAQQRKPVE